LSMQALSTGGIDVTARALVPAAAECGHIESVPASARGNGEIVENTKAAPAEYQRGLDAL